MTSVEKSDWGQATIELITSFRLNEPRLTVHAKEIHPLADFSFPFFNFFPGNFGNTVAAEIRFPRLTKSGLIDHLHRPLSPSLLDHPCFPAQRGGKLGSRIFPTYSTRPFSILPRAAPLSSPPFPRTYLFFPPRLSFSRRFLPLAPLAPPPFTDASQTLAGILRRIPLFLPTFPMP